MELFTKATTRQGRSMEKEGSSGLIRVCTMESSLTITSTEKVGVFMKLRALLVE